MTYRYLYQTKDNENRSGEIKARNRAEAYAALRKQGIRPYRVIGDDPPKWHRWAAWGTGAVFFCLMVALVSTIFNGIGADDIHPVKRGQLVGDTQVIARGVADGWDGVFETALDRRLAAYAQPGWKLEPPEATEEEVAHFADDLETPLLRTEADAAAEVRQLKNIVLGMRRDMKEYLANGGTVADYLEFLEERQTRECDLRDKARETLARAPEPMRRRAWLNLNVRLGDMGIAPLPEPLP